MVLNRNGMTALIDAMVFMILMMMVFSVTLGYIQADDDFSEAGNALDSLCAVEVRTSDMTDLEDGTLVFLTDLMAYHTQNGNGPLGDYIKSVLDRQCAGRAYCLTMTYMDRESVIGTEVKDPASRATRDVPVSMGGSVRLVLSFAS